MSSPRLPADGREEDVEVARQRARPQRGDRPLRRRRAALLLLREVSFGQDGNVSAAGFRGALRVRARQRLGQPREPDAGDDRALPRRRRSRGRADPALAVGDDALDGRRRGRPRAARPRRAEPGAGGDLGAGAAAQPLRRGDEAVGAGQGRRRRPSASTRSSTTSPRGSGCSPCSCIPTCPRPAASCSTRWPRETASSTPSAPAPAARRIERIPPLFPEARAATS